MPIASSPFEVERVDEDTPMHQEEGVRYVRSRLTKSFRGDIEGSSVVEMLSVRSDGSGAGYVGVERVSGTVHGLRGTFALLHVGTIAREVQWGRWPVVTGSGTAELVGITGEARIDIAPGGQHTLILDYNLESR